MKTRIISGTIAAILLLAGVFSGLVPFRIAVGLLSAGMVFGLLRAMSISVLLKIPSILLVAFYTAGVIPIAWITPILCFYIWILLFILLLKHETIHISHAGMAFLGTAYIGIFMGCLTAIRTAPNGLVWIWFVFLGAWLSDVFAYFIGLAFGKRKLIPSVSPKKTVAGAVGGAVGTALGFVVLGLCFLSKTMDVNIPGLALAGFLASASGQVGDLVASVIKRQYGIKDYGKIMPGHGGFMDRFDSILFVAPMVYLFMQIAL